MSGMFGLLFLTHQASDAIWSDMFIREHEVMASTSKANTPRVINWILSPRCLTLSTAPMSLTSGYWKYIGGCCRAKWKGTIYGSVAQNACNPVAMLPLTFGNCVGFRIPTFKSRRSVTRIDIYISNQSSLLEHTPFEISMIRSPP
ncbi:hypothetical protein VNO78_12465 [Psophocarpus tetragonolobus]|uniref:Uncharacterized protein n=1 Tax=Psophocarpus tetragonolobus TaxID=3891 RepID=A0AAN9SP13_PSOTE